MSKIHHSLSLKVIGLVLAQNGIFAALLFYMVRDASLAETLVIFGALIVSALATAALANRTLGALRIFSDDLAGSHDGRSGFDEKHLHRTDEIGTIAREVERLSRENLTRLIEDDEERDRRDKQDAEQQEQHTRQMAAADAQVALLKGVLENLDQAMRRFAAGDLSGRLDKAFPQDFEGLRADFNQAMLALQGTLDDIESGARVLHSSCANAREEATAALQTGSRQYSAIAKAATEIGSIAETLRTRKMQAEHTANIAYNARLDMRRPKEAVHATAQAMASARDASLKIEPVAKLIREIAFEANLLAMNIGIEAAHHDGQTMRGISGSPAENIRSLAERAATAAKDISMLSRQSADAAEQGSQSIGRAEAEIDAMSVYMDALSGHLETIAASSSTEIEKVASIRLSVLALAKNGHDQSIVLEKLATRADHMMQEISMIDHHAGRFTPVTVLSQHGTTIQPTVKSAKRGSHLRLVKS